MANLKRKNKYRLYQESVASILFIFSFILLPVTVKAANIYFFSESQDIYQGDTFVVETRISSPDKSINAVEGSLLFDNNGLEVKELSTGGSLFSLWLEQPVFSNEEGRISFVGGVPGGFQGKEAEILKIIFFAKNEGKAKLDFRDDISVFLNDGQGTQMGPWVEPLTLSISKRPTEIPPKDEWQRLLKEDTTPPEPFEVVVSRDPTIFNNQYFISFFTTDKESGVDRYEIQEGTEPYIVGNSPYLLKDQKIKSVIRVKAIDKAENERLAELAPISPQYFYQTVWFWLVIILAIIILIFIRAIKAIFNKKNV